MDVRYDTERYLDTRPSLRRQLARRWLCSGRGVHSVGAGEEMPMESKRTWLAAAFVAALALACGDRGGQERQARGQGGAAGGQDSQRGGASGGQATSSRDQPAQAPGATAQQPPSGSGGTATGGMASGGADAGSSPAASAGSQPGAGGPGAIAGGSAASAAGGGSQGGTGSAAPPGTAGEGSAGAQAGGTGAGGQATASAAPAGGKARQITGRVEKVTSKAVTLEGGQVRVDEQTQFKRGGETIQRGDLKPGAEVRASYEPQGELAIAKEIEVLGAGASQGETGSAGGGQPAEGQQQQQEGSKK